MINQPFCVFRLFFQDISEKCFCKCHAGTHTKSLPQWTGCTLYPRNFNFRVSWRFTVQLPKLFKIIKTKPPKKYKILVL